MNNKTLKIKPTRLTRENFALYGDVIEVNNNATHFSINDGFTERYHDLASINVGANSGTTLVNIFRSRPVAQPITIKTMERHPLSSQSFIPMGNQPYLVIVTPAGEFNETEIKVFIASPNQGVNYFAGTWHHYSLALNSVSDFLVIDRGGDDDNCDEVCLINPFVVELEK